jgi:hypothetical protein
LSKSDALENGLLLLLFKNTNFANIGDATGLRGSTTAGSLYLSFHTADPGEGGDQSTNEVTNYARASYARASGGQFTVTGNSVTLPAADAYVYRTAGQGDATVTHWGLGTASSGAGVLLYSAALSSSVVISGTKAIRITAGFTIVSED